MLRHPTLDPAFKELVLTLPSEVYVAEQLDERRPAAHPRGARGDAAAARARACATTGCGPSKRTRSTAATRPTRCSAGRRALANLALAMLCLRRARSSGDPVWPGRAYQRFKDAGNMTDRLGALAALVDRARELADAALERFHAMFRHEPLVIDKWFALQARRAGARRAGVFERVKALIAHPDFTLAEPEPRAQPDRHASAAQPGGLPPRRRAPATCSGPTACSSSTRSTRSSRRASRARSTAGRQLAEPYRGAAREAIARVAAQAELSDDMREIVSRALACRRLRWPAQAPPKNAFYAQSGGVTAVINASACGVIETARAHRDAIGKVYAGRNGIIGALTEDLIDTGKESAAAIRALRSTPSGAFGSCRYKLKSLETNRREYERLIEVFQAHDIAWFFYNGGGDSADTCFKVSQLSAAMGYPLQAIHVPKTVDNDLPITDCCPGFGSVAKYVAVSALEASFDVRSMARTSTKVFVLEVMGRHAGWIAAAGGLIEEHGIPVVDPVPRDRVRREEVHRPGRRAGEGARLLHRGRLRGRAPRRRQLPRRAGHARRVRPRPARRRRAGRRATWSSTRSATSSTGRWPTTCSARPATSPPRPTSSRPTSWASARSSWR